MFVHGLTLKPMYLSFLLTIFRLSGCDLSEKSCETLYTVIDCQPPSLKELDLSNNDLQDSGVKIMFARLKSQHCTLVKLR